MAETKNPIPSILINPPEVETAGKGMPDWDECLGIENEWWDMSNECHTRESLLFDSMTAESIAASGVQGYWYVVDYSLENEKLFGEDNDRTIERKFPFMFHVDQLPTDSRSWAKFGIEGLDVFHIYVAKTAFLQASQMMSDGETVSYKQREPKVGDIVQSTHNGVFYRVLDIKDKADTILQRAHSFDIILSQMEMAHHNVSDLLIDENDEILQHNDIPDILGQNTAPINKMNQLHLDIQNTIQESHEESDIDREADKVLYKNRFGKIDDPFGLFDD